MPLSQELCEFVGAVIGDGNITKYPRTGQVSICGHPELDLAYHHYLASLAAKLFGMGPRVIARKDRVQTRIYSLALYKLFTKRFGFTSGPKSYTTNIPDEIFYCGDEFRAAVLRGLFDTDGGVGTDKRKIYKKPYVRINFVSTSFNLVQRICSILDDFNIHYGVHLRDYITPQLQIQINGEVQVKKFLTKIGFSNERHLRKLSHLAELP
jgi:hypothetical protein